MAVSWGDPQLDSRFRRSEIWLDRDDVDAAWEESARMVAELRERAEAFTAPQGTTVSTRPVPA